MKLSANCLTASFLLLSLLAGSASAKELPQKHPYQQTLRGFLATLTEKDFEHGVTEEFSKTPGSEDPEVQYRNYLLSLLNQPLIGTKRGMPALNAPARLFTLSEIEQPEAVMVPPVWPETLIPVTQWKYAGNPYYDNRALKLRAFVTACVKMIMQDEYLETDLELGGARSDLLAYHLVIVGSPYPGFKDELPKEVQQAYLTGLEKMGRRILEWGPEGEEPHMDMIAPVGLWYVSQALGDPGFANEVEAYARKLLEDPAKFHPAGYGVDRGGADIGYQGMSNLFATWLALATDWPFAKEAVERSYRLRAHLCLPEPDGKLVGPTHFNTRLSSVPSRDQWEWGVARDTFASLVTDEAFYLTHQPTAEELAQAEAKQAGNYQSHLKENPRRQDGTHLQNEEIGSTPWKWRMWQTYNFMASVNFGYEFYPQGTFAHRRKLIEENSPYLKSPFQREETFVRDFADAFTVTKQSQYSAIVHTGHVGAAEEQTGFRQFAGPLGFGGGQLSAFWTPEAGSILLGRRGGMSREKNFDLLEDWRVWPLHAVSGCRADGKVFTSARILRPLVTTAKTDGVDIVRVKGMLPPGEFEQGRVLEGRWEYQRSFDIHPDYLQVSTALSVPGQDIIAELYETLPVYLQETSSLQEQANVVIEVESGGKWTPATVEGTADVSSVRVFRHQGGAKITFDRPRRVMLSPKVWQDAYLSRAECRTLLIDLLESPTGPVVLKGERSISYRIEPIKR